MLRALPLLLAVSLPTPLLAQAVRPVTTDHDDRPRAAAVRIESPVRIDGRLDDEAWARAEVVDRFTQIEPQEGQPASQATEARILYDDEALYVGVRLHDTGAVTGRLGRRDMPFGDSDWLGVMIDSRHDHRTAFGFDVNPAGVKHDEVKVIETDDFSWDPVWDVATTVDEGGWIAEMRIPFSQLRFSAEREQTWGLQLERIIGRTSEYSVSTFIPKSVQGGVPGYGHLVGLSDIRPGKRLEILPYTVLRSEHVEPGQNPYRATSEQGVSAGVDVKYRLTSNLTLDASLNPDFGQVEVDPAVINLGVNETRYEEKRPFFIEGSEVFQFNIANNQVFYSRRVGRAPQLAAPTLLADVPGVTTILGAGKLSGKTANGWSVGVMEVVTQEERARYLDGQGRAGDAVVEPLTNYFVGRARRDLRAGASAVGGILTAVNRDVGGTEASPLLRGAAYTAGADFRHEWADRHWRLSGALAMSHVRGDPAAIVRTKQQSNHFFQRPDAEHLEIDSTATAMTGMAGTLELQRQAGEHWRGAASVAFTTPAFEINDLGFNTRNDRRDVQASVTYLENRPAGFWRDWQSTGRIRNESSFDDRQVSTSLFASWRGRHLRYWTLSADVLHWVRAYDDRFTRGGPVALRPAFTRGSGSFASDARRPLTLELGGNGERNEFDGWIGEGYFNVGVKTSPRWNLTIGPRFTRQHVVAQYVTTVPDATATATFGRRYLFAPLDYTEISLETRLNYTFQPGLSLEMYAQPLLSSGGYGDPIYFAEPGAFRFEPFAGPAPDRDFNLRSLRGNAVLRWDWRAGSTLYVAWQQSREDADVLGDFDFSRDRAALLRARPDNIFLVKVNYWLNP